QELAAREAGTGLVRAGWHPSAEPSRPAPVAEPRREEPPTRPTVWTPGMGLKEVSRRAAHDAEHVVIKQVLEEVRWNRVEAARRLKISYKALLYKIQMYELANSRPAGKKLP